jgi:hypothetical protein
MVAGTLFQQPSVEHLMIDAPLKIVLMRRMGAARSSATV